MPERPRLNELDPFLARAYAETFIPRWDGYPLQVRGGTYVQVKEGLTTEQVMRHLTRQITLGTYALDSQNCAKWLCLDADAPEQWQALLGLAQNLTDSGIPIYRELSRRGGHLWLFTANMLGADIRIFARGLLTLYAIPASNKLEIYPKQDELGDGLGSFVRLPLGVHLKTGQVYPFVDQNGKPLAPTIRQQIAVLSNPKRVPQDFIQQVLAAEPEKPLPSSPSQKPKRAMVAPRSEPPSEAIKRAVSVLEFVGRYVRLNEQGRGLCPFHDDHAKSFAVNAARNYWHCFAGCGGGSVLDFWMKWREANGQDGSFTATVRDLREMLL